MPRLVATPRLIVLAIQLAGLVLAFGARSAHAQSTLLSNGQFDVNTAGWQGAKLRNGSVVSAPELLTRVTAGTWSGSAGSLQVGLQRQAGFDYRSYTSGAVATLASSAPAGTTLKVDFAARSVSGAAYLNIARAGGNGHTTTAITSSWARYTAYVFLDQATTQLAFSAVPKESEAQQTLQNFQLLLDDVRVTAVESGFASLASNGFFESSLSPWVGRKVSGSSVVSASELLSRSTADSAHAGGGALELNISKRANFSYPSDNSGAYLPLQETVATGSILRVSLAAKHVSGANTLAISTGAGSAQSFVTVTPSWGTYTAELVLNRPTTGLVISIVASASNAATAANGIVRIDDVDVRRVGLPQDGLSYDYRADKCVVPAQATGNPTVCPDVRPFNPNRMFLEAGPLPTIESSTGGFPAVVGHEGGRFTTTGSPQALDSYSMAYVLRKSTPGTSSLMWHESSPGVGVKLRRRPDLNAFQIFWNLGNALHELNGIAAYAPELPSHTDVGELVVVRGNSAGAELWINGVLHDKGARAMPRVSMDGILLDVGAGDQLEMSEALAYDHALTDAELGQLHRVLRTRYGISKSRPAYWFSADVVHELRADGTSDIAGYELRPDQNSMIDATNGHAMWLSSDALATRDLVPFGNGHWAYPFSGNGDSIWLSLSGWTTDADFPGKYAMYYGYGEYLFTLVLSADRAGAPFDLTGTTRAESTTWTDGTMPNWWTLQLDPKSGAVKYGNWQDPSTYKGTSTCVVPRGVPTVISFRGSRTLGTHAIFVNGVRVYQDSGPVPGLGMYPYFGDTFRGKLADATVSLELQTDNEIVARHQALMAQFGVPANATCDVCGDGQVTGTEQCDSQDPGCSAGCSIVIDATSEVSCTDGVDNDADGLVDCADTGDCRAASVCRLPGSVLCATTADCRAGQLCPTAPNGAAFGSDPSRTLCVDATCVASGVCDPLRSATCGDCFCGDACGLTDPRAQFDGASPLPSQPAPTQPPLWGRVAPETVAWGGSQQPDPAASAIAAVVSRALPPLASHSLP